MTHVAPVLLDFESRSRADLGAVGGRKYWEHPSSEALVVVWYDTADGTVGAWYPGQAWPHRGRVLAAHNAHGFDRFGAERYDFGAAGWIDTSQLARKAGLPGALDALGQRWCGIPKDKEASRFTASLSSVRRPTRKHGAAEIPADVWRDMSDDERRARGVLPELDAKGFARVVSYCASDVAILAEAWPRLSEWLDVDADVEALDRVINDRGVAFDAALARRLLHEDARIARIAVADAAAKLGMTPEACAAAARSPKQFCEIVGTPDARADTIEHIEHPLADARRALASIARGKLTAGLARVHADGRLRDTLRYYGAHTGRWSGRGMQLQNMPRPAKRLADAIESGELSVDAFADEVLRGRECDADEIALLVRATITASRGNLLAVQDFSSIEARATAWAAGDDAAIDVFRSGRDPYKVAATAVFGVPYDAVTKAQRQIGKVCELALGYQGGPGAFTAMARAYRLDLTRLDLAAIVAAWRTLHAPIKSLWYACERAFRSAIRGRPAWAGPFEYVPADDGSAVACFLPSGRPIVYHAARAVTGDESLAYLGTRGTEHLYGGKLVENAIQALCRDLMAGAMLRAERAGLNPVLTVHDEIVCDVPEAQAERAGTELHAAMLELPAWAAGFPIGADGWVGRRYRK